MDLNLTDKSPKNGKVANFNTNCSPDEPENNKEESNPKALCKSSSNFDFFIEDNKSSTKKVYRKLDFDRIKEYKRRNRITSHTHLGQLLEDSEKGRNRHNSKENFTILNNYGVSVSFHSLLALKNGEMLDDEVLNYYFKLRAIKSLEDKKKDFFFSTFFYSALSTSEFGEIKSWASARVIKKYLDRYNRNKTNFEINNIFDFDRVFIPVHLGIHWTLAVFDMKNKEATYLDSMGSRDESVLDAIKDYFTKIAELEKVEPINFENKFENSNLQSNGVDCGVYVCMNTFVLTKGAYKFFTAEEASGFRSFLYTQFLYEDLLEKGKN